MVATPLEAGLQVRDYLVVMGASIVATKAIVKRTVHFDSSSHPQHPVGDLVARVVVAKAVQILSKVH